MSTRLAAALSAFSAAVLTAALLVLVIAPGASGGPGAKPKPKLRISTAVATDEVSGGQSGGAKATCPKGASAIGGGADANGVSIAYLARSSERTFSGSFQNPAGGPAEVTVQAICVKGAGVTLLDNGSGLKDRAP